MAKLYAQSAAFQPSVLPAPVTAPDSSASLESLYVQLDNHTKAYASVQDIYGEIAGESLTFVDKKNVVLFNEYMRLLQSNFGVEVKTVHPVAMESMHPVSVNYELSLEGWLKDMWAKIKAFFSKIFTAIGDFMKRHFTRLGRLKAKLKNLVEVAGETKKVLGVPRIEDLPGGLASKMKGFDDVSESSLSELVKTANGLVENIGKASEKTRTISKDQLVNADYINGIKKLRDQALAATNQIKSNSDQKKDLTRTDRREVNADNKNLEKIAQDAKKEADARDGALAGAGAGQSMNEDALVQKGEEAFKTYSEVVIGFFGEFKGKKLAGGKSIKTAELNNENELVIEFEESDIEPKGATLTNKDGIAKLCGDALKMVELAEKQAEPYAKANDEISKCLQTLDNLILDIDRVDPVRYGNYKKMLDKSIRTRLKLLQTMTRSFNQIGRNFFEIATDTGDAVVDYSVLSMKNFK